MFGFRKKTEAPSERILPVHIAIKMDGNRRWAKQHHVPRQAGHVAGSEAFKTIARYCNKIGVQYLTVYAFSSENWKRSEDEVSGLMSLLRKNLRDVLTIFRDENIRTRFIGDRTRLDAELQALMAETEEVSENRTGLRLNIAINYGGRPELVAAARAIAEDVRAGTLAPEAVDANVLASHLETAGQPDPDLVIMPGAEKRISNFLLWQSAYAEYWFSDVLWPDFTPDVLEQAIADFNTRKRRFGGS
ncbi:polyprenyl diphosphate synthase [Ethanoligenens harbinense]|uniref:Isoprenyl transferase n=1 Tax=Ethanoligenens harbinense (strain DSM 18485 / JCM 12961 / CGMCC 1.5033 / YUAN-3) TaxID=663278 RepID=E6U8S1_ETHHY|nr:polyprenyl diphosphate synthase [Ethanoligenens harbinense]ADU27156.1 undecaprenyl diphosphate synthase [Ethanoligenens harbinense YUAN-3]AVQ96227.1 di-trans,poly-cis-decaprenylcistransferase [Ethanoligenens harbinense YUAN-3]AYF38887.1 di-trans,poly-cis-decaprenylcistransferase [Ethanoligenens harbinense]AYF41637.1 di-trans,poly-cis-decaprenylcistransferase [Ethanoligenens harbinense]QCN92468.1 di-trans,poly-cis-decaprenylcistransferase [Ethanoligenens harbinense]